MQAWRLLTALSLVRVRPGEPNLRKAVGDLSGGLSLCLDRRRFRNEIKWLAQNRGQFPVLPGAVRNQEIEEPPFFARVLLCEKALGVLGQFEKAHAVFEIGLVTGKARSGLRCMEAPAVSALPSIGIRSNLKSGIVRGGRSDPPPMAPNSRFC